MSNLTLGSLFDGSGGFPLGGLLSRITPVWSSEVEPFAVRVTTKRMPFIKHYGNICDINGREVEPVDIITFGSPCFPKGTLVLTVKGYTEIENIQVGDVVLTHKGRWKKVTAVGSKQASTVILRGNHYGLECTPNHPIYSTDTEKENKRLSDKRDWTAAENMLGKLWAVPRKIEYLPIESPHTSWRRNQKPMPEMNADFFYFLGRWLGDGWVRDGQRSKRPKGQRFGQIVICDSLDKESELRTAVEKVTDKYHTEIKDNVIKFKFCGQVFTNWLTDNFGKYARNKYLPSWVYGLGNEYRAALLKGMLDSDGNRVKDKEYLWRITTVSKKLAEGLRLLCELQGYSLAVFKTIPSEKGIIQGRIINQRPSYTVQLCGNTDRLRPHYADENHSWYRVRSVTPTNEYKTVYNLTVEEDNSYIADGIVVHNCQDMSLAGKRSGLDGSRSSLFYEAIRIVKEMREKTNGKYPRYIVWENVPGAFSSNSGKDFKAVLDAVIGIKEQNAEVPMPENGNWAYADCIMGNGWSVAYRVLDAQYWGVPQRRRRIYLVADFGGRSAKDILFKSEGMSRNFKESVRAWKGATDNTKTCVRATGFDGYNGAVDEKSATLGVNCGMSTGRNGVVLNDQGGNRMDITEEVTCTLRAEAHHPPCVMESAGFCTEHSADSRSIGYEKECSPTLRAGVIPGCVFENHSADTRYKGPIDVAPTISATYGTGGNNQPFVVKPKTMKIRCGKDGGGKGSLIQEDKSATLSCNNDQTLFEPKNWDGGQIAPTLTKQNAGGNQRMPDKDNFNCVLEPFGISSKDSNAMKSSNPKSGIYKAETARTIDSSGGNPSCNQGGIAVVEQSICIQGSMIGRKDENGPQGSGVNENKSFTLNATDRHAVYAMTTGSFTQVEKDKSPTLMARDFKDPNAVCYGIGRDTFNQGKNAKFAPSFKEECQPTMVAKGPGAVLKPISFYPQMKAECQSAREDTANTLVNGTNPGYQNGVVETDYTVRRLTPTECARLQGFPDWWCKELGTEKPTDEEVYFWHKVFETKRKIDGNGKPKTDKQIRKWLSNPYTDSAEYKLWGNGVALPCVYFVLSGIVWANENIAEIKP